MMQQIWLALAFPLVAVFVMAVAGAPSEVNDMPLVFQTDFESGDTSGWVMTDPKAWKIELEDGNHVLSQFKSSDYSPPVRSPVNIARIDGLDVGNFVLEVRMKQTGKEYGHRDMCIFFGYNDPSHFYYVHLATKADDHANSIFLVNGAPRVSIAQDRTAGTDWATGYRTVRIERDASAGTILVYFDDMTKPVMKTVDKTFLSGGIGFGTFDDTGNIDDVRIWGRKVEKPSE
jgi:hypothetical protein